MSLINEALKKAQAQQNAGQRPLNSDAPAPSPAPPKKSSILSVLLILGSIVITFAAIVGLIVWGVLTLREDKTDIAATPPPPAAVAETPKEVLPQKESLPPIQFKVQADAAESPSPETTKVSTAPETPPAPSPKPTPPPPFSTEPSVASTPVAPPTPPPAKIISASPPPKAPPAPTIVKSKPTSPSVQPPASTPSTQAPPAPVVGHPDAIVRDFIDRLQIRGVMSGGKKALIYNEETQRSRAYGTGSTINNELRIRILSITEHSITFIDHAGVTYLKQF